MHWRRVISEWSTALRPKPFAPAINTCKNFALNRSF